jgi:hypothetical protein
MGGGRWTDSDWATYSSTTTKTAKTVNDIYKSSGMIDDFNPSKITLRESRDSVDNPNSNALIVALDVTGSMDSVLEAMAREGLKTLATEIYARKPISDPHIMYMGVGDVDAGDRAPLQVTQFEADIRIAEQMMGIWLERHGGGNSYEGYNLPWYFAGMKTSIDCFEKRGKKGYLFTVGDEETPKGLSVAAVKRVFGDTIQDNLTNEQLLAMVSRSYHVYHLIVNQGSHYRGYGARVDSKWRELLGQRAMNLTDHTKMSEVIVSTIQANEGFAKEEILDSWDGKTSLVVAHALKDTDIMVKNGGSGIVTFE